MCKVQTRVYVLFLFCVIGVQFFLSCSNEIPSIVSQKVALIFDFSTGKDSATQRLSVYVQDSDVERIKEFRIDYSSENLIWQTDSPVRRSLSTGEWVGSSQFFMQGTRAFPVGEYSLQIANFTGNTTSGKFSLEYPEALLSEKSTLTIEDLQKRYPELDIYYTTVYNDANKVVYFVNQKLTKDEIKEFAQSNPEASSVQYYIESSTKPYAVLLSVNPIL